MKGGVLTATIQKNSQWHDLREVKKGDYGELLVKSLLEKQGYILYRPDTDGAHGFDSYAYKNGRIEFAVEVKTKPKCKKYPETGFDERQYQKYIKLSKENNVPVRIFFVDEDLAEIYGNDLAALDKPYDDPTQSKPYPKVVGHTGGANLTRYFPMKHMKKFASLSPSEVATLKILNGRQS